MARWVGTTVAERPEACAEWRDDLADWLMATISPEREAVLAAHVAGCGACRAEADALFAVTAVVLAADPEAPTGSVPEPAPPALGDRIVRRVRRERRGRVARRALVSAIGAAAAAAVVVVALVAVGDDGPDRIDGETFAMRTLPAGASVDVEVAHDEGDSSLVQLVATGLDPDTTYALWLTPPGGTYPDRVPAGTFRPDDDGRVDVRLHSAMDPDRVGRVWATTPAGIAFDTEA
jgi:hypothetical protein